MIFICAKKIEVCPNCFQKQEENASACPNCGLDFSDKSKIAVEAPKVSKLLKFRREKTFYSNYGFNLVECPECSSKVLYDDAFCYNCGCEVSHVKERLPSFEKIRVSKLLRFRRRAKFMANYDFNLKECPQCDSKLLKNSKYCYSCGVKVKSDGEGENKNFFKGFDLIF